jgi:hypothetical protein
MPVSFAASNVNNSLPLVLIVSASFSVLFSLHAQNKIKHSINRGMPLRKFIEIRVVNKRQIKMKSLLKAKLLCNYDHSFRLRTGSEKASFVKREK